MTTSATTPKPWISAPSPDNTKALEIGLSAMSLSSSVSYGRPPALSVSSLSTAGEEFEVGGVNLMQCKRNFPVQPENDDLDYSTCSESDGETSPVRRMHPSPIGKSGSAKSSPALRRSASAIEQHTDIFLGGRKSLSFLEVRSSSANEIDVNYNGTGRSSVKDTIDSTDASGSSDAVGNRGGLNDCSYFLSNEASNNDDKYISSYSELSLTANAENNIHIDGGNSNEGNGNFGSGLFYSNSFDKDNFLRGQGKADVGFEGGSVSSASARARAKSVPALSMSSLGANRAQVEQDANIPPLHFSNAWDGSPHQHKSPMSEGLLEEMKRRGHSDISDDAHFRGLPNNGTFSPDKNRSDGSYEQNRVTLNHSPQAPSFSAYDASYRDKLPNSSVGASLRPCIPPNLPRPQPQLRHAMSETLASRGVHDHSNMRGNEYDGSPRSIRDGMHVMDGGPSHQHKQVGGYIRGGDHPAEERNSSYNRNLAGYDNRTRENDQSPVGPGSHMQGYQQQYHHSQFNRHGSEFHGQANTMKSPSSHLQRGQMHNNEMHQGHYYSTEADQFHNSNLHVNSHIRGVNQYQDAGNHNNHTHQFHDNSHRQPGTNGVHWDVNDGHYEQQATLQQQHHFKAQNASVSFGQQMASGRVVPNTGVAVSPPSQGPRGSYGDEFDGHVPRSSASNMAGNMRPNGGHNRGHSLNSAVAPNIGNLSMQYQNRMPPENENRFRSLSYGGQGSAPQGLYHQANEVVHPNMPHSHYEHISNAGDRHHSAVSHEGVMLNNCEADAYGYSGNGYISADVHCSHPGAHVGVSVGQHSRARDFHLSAEHMGEPPMPPHRNNTFISVRGDMHGAMNSGAYAISGNPMNQVPASLILRTNGMQQNERSYHSPSHSFIGVEDIDENTAGILLTNSGMVHPQIVLTHNGPLPFGNRPHSSSTSSIERIQGIVPQFINSDSPNASSGPRLVYNIKFKRTQRCFILGPRAPRDIKIGCYVKVEADRGEDLGFVVSRMPAEKYNTTGRSNYRLTTGNVDSGEVPAIGPGGLAADLKRVTRLATREEVALLAVKREEEEELLKICRAKVKQRGLAMNVVDAEYQFDRHKLTFFFEAEGRIDFRELVRDLFSIYKTRIWMQQLDKNGAGVAISTCTIDSGEDVNSDSCSSHPSEVIVETDKINENNAEEERGRQS